jgi:hypothetical protein
VFGYCALCDQKERLAYFDGDRICYQCFKALHGIPTPLRPPTDQEQPVWKRALNLWSVLKHS